MERVDLVGHEVEEVGVYDLDDEEVGVRPVGLLL